PICCGDPLNPPWSSSPRYALRNRKSRFGVDVLPGHPALSNIEDVMSDAWQSSLAKKTGDFRRIHWAGQLAVAMEDEDRYDYIFYDVGPSLGPFNRTVLLGCDAFVTPTSTDLFSFHAFGNLAKWFNDWVTEYSEISEGNLAQWRNYSPDISKKTRKLRLLGHDGRGLQYLGYTTLEYVKRRSNGKEQLVGAFERFRGKFGDEAKRIGDSLGHSCDQYLIGHVPHMYSMPATAQDSHSPIADLQATDGVRGTQLNQRTGYAEKIDEVAALVLERLES
ncbi:AAA family ATPase, partial [Corynebacterium sp. MSK151]|uniref:ParA family protein n=1 Tax=unclassified Corynebacterium TaxID=2624378 RepID=UPI0025514094